MYTPFKTVFLRPDGRAPNQLRPVSFQPGIAPYAAGSVLIRFGHTQVICTACFEKKVPAWMIKEAAESGWVTAEYAMLPYSTLERKQREVVKGKQEGRTIEIQRLIGRALRAVIDLRKMPGYTLWLDCDVLQADGGTRTVAITGAYLAARMAVERALRMHVLKENPFTDSVAAVSVGIYEDQVILDLNYIEDKDALVDCNVVMTGKGNFVEIQSSGEESTFSATQLQGLLTLAQEGLQQLTLQQQEFLAANKPASS